VSIGKRFGTTTLIALLDHEDGGRNMLRNVGDHGFIFHKIGIFLNPSRTSNFATYFMIIYPLSVFENRLE
jgi:hypothetical protein